MNRNKQIFYRVVVIYVLALLFALVIFGRILQLQIMERDKWSQAQAVTYTYRTMEPKRGVITDANGKILSTSITWYEIALDLRVKSLQPYFTGTNDSLSKQIDSLAIRIAEILPGSKPSVIKNELYQKFRDGQQFFLKKEFTYSELKKISKFPVLRKNPKSMGLVSVAHSKRVQPFGELAFRTIGRVEENGTARIGIEGAYNNILKGVEGLSLMQKLANDVWMPVNDPDDKPPQDGSDIVSTIDINIQDIVHSALIKQLEYQQAEYGTAVVMEVRSGEIKAIANLTDTLSGYREFYNYAFGDVGSTEPGSTFKLASLLAAMEDGFIDLEDTIDTGNGKVQYYGKEMKDTRESGYGKISVKDVFAHSSNVGVSKIIQLHYQDKKQQFVDRLYAMNLNSPLGIDLVGEGIPYIKSPEDKNWYGTTLPWMSIGYEVKLTPLQILAFYNAVANNGILVKPRFVKSLKKEGRVTKIFRPEVINPSICSKSTIAKARLMLEEVVLTGTATNLKALPFKVAGKTGTARIAYGKDGYDGDKKYQSSFVGYFPADNPKYSCIVVVNSPKIDYYGSVVAGEVFREIAHRIYASSFEFSADRDSTLAAPPVIKNGLSDDLAAVLDALAIPVSEKLGHEWVTAEVKSGKAIINKIPSGSPGLIPDVTGMGARDALYILENAGLEVQFRGKGKVIQLSSPAGTKFRKGEKITVLLG